MCGSAVGRWRRLHAGRWGWRGRWCVGTGASAGALRVSHGCHQERNRGRDGGSPSQAQLLHIHFLGVEVPPPNGKPAKGRLRGELPSSCRPGAEAAGWSLLTCGRASGLREAFPGSQGGPGVECAWRVRAHGSLWGAWSPEGHGVAWLSLGAMGSVWFLGGAKI